MSIISNSLIESKRIPILIRFQIKFIIAHRLQFAKLEFTDCFGLLCVLFLNLMECFADVAADPFAFGGLFECFECGDGLRVPDST